MYNATIELREEREIFFGRIPSWKKRQFYHISRGHENELKYDGKSADLKDTISYLVRRLEEENLHGSDLHVKMTGLKSSGDQAFIKFVLNYPTS